MTNNLPLSPSLALKLSVVLHAFVLIALVASSACQSSVSTNESEARGVIIVNAPATGEIRRVLVREGMSVNKDAPIVEIAVRTEAPSRPQETQREDPQARAARNVQATQAEIEAARADAVRAEVEMQRLTPLVASGDAPQAQLDAARAEFDRAQQRLQRAQASAQEAQNGLVAARQQSQNSSTVTMTPTEQIVTARTSSAGTVSVINARVGEQVAAGQPLATLRAE
jgi:multidrug resistance efflux pump